MRRVIAFSVLYACSSPLPPQPWPAGSYCVLRDGERCPRATNGEFEPGQIVIDTDNGMTLDGAHGSSRQLRDDDNDGLLSIEVCCGTFEDAGEAFPRESFVVLAGGTPGGAVSCPAGFTPGSVFVDAEDTEALGDDAESHTTGIVGATTITVQRNVDLIVCESGPSLDGFEMPRANYCVFGGRGESCPAGFARGVMTTYDEASGNTNELTGTVGGITQPGASTEFPVCCY